MKQLMLVMSLLVTALPALSLRAAECDCTKVPFAPPSCFKVCAGRVLAVVNKEEMILVLKIDQSIVEKIVLLEGRKNAESLDDFKKVLNEDDIKRVTRCFEALSSNDFKKIQTKVAAGKVESDDKTKKRPDTGL